MATDYQNFIKTDGRDDLIKQVRKRIDAIANGGIESSVMRMAR